MICADVVEASASSPAYFAPAASQPADMQACAAVVLTGTDTSALATYAFPTSADAGEAWSLGFVLVVSAYLIGWGAGTVVNFIRSR